MSGKKTSSPERLTRIKASTPDREQASVTNFQFRAPDPEAFAFPDPFNNRRLLAYYDRLRLAHGYIRFVSLPHLDDRPDVPIDRLYVPSRLAARHLRANEDPENWDKVEDLLESLAANPRLVVLGDPGSGKSTLVSWVAWQLSSARGTAYCRRLGPLVPLPLVLRDLQIDGGITWDGLLDRFTGQEFQRLAEEGKGRLARVELAALLGTGQAMVLLDGLDEIGSVAVRRALHAAILEGMARHSGCRFLFTSRIVGYEDASLEHFSLEDELEPSALPLRVSASKGKVRISRDLVEIRYVAPFDDRQIERFAQAWYARFASESGAAGELRAQELVAAISAHPATQRLARVPILLTFIALIHRVEARLPEGRVRLYGKIADAYLESIDAYRRLHHAGGSPYSLEEKRRWLAFAAFQLQRRRAQETSESQEILADEEDLVGWLARAMARSRSAAAEEPLPKAEAQAFLDYLARRSGLLLPRGEGRYAFAHLSIQEYFAAEHLRLVRRSRRWIDLPRNPNGDGPEDLRDYADQIAWAEVLFLLFELYAGDPEGAGELAEDLFGQELERIEAISEKKSGQAKHPQESSRVALLAHVSVDLHGGLDAVTRRKAWMKCWRWEIAAYSSRHWHLSSQRTVPQVLLSAEESDHAGVIAALIAVLGDPPYLELSLGGVKCDSFEWLSAVPWLKSLDLDHTRLTDLAFLNGFSQLAELRIDGTQVKNLEPLRDLTTLQWLDLSNTQVTSLEPLHNLIRLDLLFLADTAITDLEPLRNLTRLEFLFLAGTRVTDLEPLRDLRNLTRLHLGETQATNLEPLRKLTALTHLDLGDTQVTNLEPLRNLRKLESLDLSKTQVKNLEPLRNLRELKSLDLSKTQVTNLEPLRNLRKLESLDLNKTQVKNLEPIRNHTKLRALDLSETQVAEVEPLVNLASLQTLVLRNTAISDLDVLSHLKNLKISRDR